MNVGDEIPVCAASLEQLDNAPRVAADICSKNINLIFAWKS